MNERIKELAEQATKEVWGTNPFNGSPEFEGYELDQEKFAELIIAECLDQCYYRGMNDELYAGQLRAALYIEQHFGVEP